VHKILYPRGVTLIFQGRFFHSNLELLHEDIERLCMNEIYHDLFFFFFGIPFL
jgi:hypothetical protein